MTDNAIVIAAGVAGRYEPELASRVAAKKVSADDSVTHDVSRSRCDSFVVEGCRCLSARQMRLLLDRDRWREYLLAETVEEKRRLAIKASAAHRVHEVSGGSLYRKSSFLL